MALITQSDSAALISPSRGVFAAATLAELKTFTVPLVNQTVEVDGSVSRGDGLAGTYYWNTTDSRADNGTTIIASNAGGVGRWNLVAATALDSTFTPAGAGAVARPVQTDLRELGISVERYGASTLAADNTAAINAALVAANHIIFPGIYPTTQTIIVPNGKTLDGVDRGSGGINYTGTGSAFQNVNGPNSSGYGKVTFKNLKVITASGSNTGAAIELNAGGFAFYEIDTCWLTGTFKYGLILDGAEVTHAHHNIIENGAVANGANIWLVNGADRVGAQTTGFTNSITINDNQCNITGAGTVNIIDDGGSDHTIVNNNLNGAHTPLTLAGLNGFVIFGNGVENALAGAATGLANILVTNVGHVSGAVKGACQGGKIAANNLSADMAAGAGVSLTFAGAMHQGIRVFGNWFRNNGGGIADIDLTKLSNSVVGPNYHITSGRFLYTGTHNDADGNILFPPQNGFAGTFGEAAYLWGDNRYPFQFANKLYPGTDGAAIQSAAGIYAGNGVPNNANGANGDFYFRGDGTQAGNTVIYHKQSGSWVALITT